MRFINHLLNLSLGIGVMSLPGFASIVTESESNGTEVNNTIATAQAIPVGAFTLPVPATVFNPPGLPTATIQGLGGLDDVDFFSFFAYAGPIYLDVDNSPATFDPIIALFNSAGTLLAYGDDSPLDPGSVNTIDSFLGLFILPSAGTYYIGISENPNFPSAALTGTETALTKPGGGAGGVSVSGVTAGLSSYDFNGPQTSGLAYTLHVSTVPEPGSVLLVGTALGLLALTQRKRKG